VSFAASSIAFQIGLQERDDYPVLLAVYVSDGIVAVFSRTMLALLELNRSRMADGSGKGMRGLVAHEERPFQLNLNRGVATIAVKIRNNKSLSQDHDSVARWVSGQGGEGEEISNVVVR
jgi:hypothetical protein